MARTHGSANRRVVLGAPAARPTSRRSAPPARRRRSAAAGSRSSPRPAARAAARAWPARGRACVLTAPKPSLPSPCTRYAASVNGAPQKPITGVRPSSSRRSSRTASATNGTVSAAGPRRQRVDLRARADRLGQLRAGVEGHPHAERLERQQDVREEDRGVEREAAQRLQRHLDGQLRRLAQRQEVHAAAAARGTRAGSGRPAA